MNEVSFDEFMNTGLLLLVNQFLHIFGFAFVGEYNDDKKFVRMYIARVALRGFSEESTTKAYINVSKYMKDNCDDLLKEAKS